MTDYKLNKEELYGYQKLEPCPSENELLEFYSKKYYELVQQGGRFPESRRLQAGGKEAENERKWLRSAFFDDIKFLIEKFAPSRRVIDIGCGAGDLLLFLAENGFEVEGLDPSENAAQAAKNAGLNVHTISLTEFVKRHIANRSEPYSALLLLNVLEHVREPLRVLDEAKKLLRHDGLICIRVPNDFSELQLAAQEKLGKNPWWVTTPDHINYFNFNSLHTMLVGEGMEIVHVQGDFPMELFLLMGHDYLDNSEVGKQCHQQRVSFELALDGTLRRKMYQALGSAGIGRTCIIAARKR